MWRRPGPRPGAHEDQYGRRGGRESGLRDVARQPNPAARKRDGDCLRERPPSPLAAWPCGFGSAARRTAQSVRSRFSSPAVRRIDPLRPGRARLAQTGISRGTRRTSSSGCSFSTLPFSADSCRAEVGSALSMPAKRIASSRSPQRIRAGPLCLLLLLGLVCPAIRLFEQLLKPSNGGCIVRCHRHRQRFVRATG